MFFRFLLLLTLLYTIATGEKLTNVSLEFAWKHQFQFAGYIVAKEKGFYKDLGLDVELKEYDGKDLPVEAVVSGISDFGIGGPNLALRNLNENLNLVFLFAMTQASPLNITTLKKSRINTLEDLRGKKLLIFGKYRRDVSITSMLKSNGIDEDSFQLVNTDKYDLKELTDGTADIVWGYSTVTPNTFKKMGYTPVSFHPKDYGYDFYSEILFATEKFVKENPTTTKNFYKASLKGWEYAFANIDETIKIIQEKYNTQNLDYDTLEFEAKKFRELAYFKGVPFGDINSIKLEKIVNSYKLLNMTTSTKTNFEHFIYKPKKVKTNINLTQKEINYINENIVFKVGVRKDLEPIDFITKEGLHSGITHDILKYISQFTGMRFVHIPLETEELISSLKNNHIDFYIDINSKKEPFIVLPQEIILNQNKVNTVKTELSFSSNNKTLNSILAKTFNTMTNEQKEALFHKWIPKIVEKPFDWTIVWVITSIFSAIVIFLLYRNIQQKKNEKETLELEVEKRTEKLNIALDDKALLLKELHHRVKNNMQMILSFLRLQNDRTSDEKINEVITNIQNRINAMGQLHELLYKQDNILEVDTHEYFENLVDELKYSFSEQVEINLNVDGNINTEQAVYCGLILNELVTNSLKYAFNNNGKIDINFHKKDAMYTLKVSDNGVGYDQNQKTDSLGLTVVKRLVKRQLDGEIDISSSDGVTTTIAWSGNE